MPELSWLTLTPVNPLVQEMRAGVSPRDEMRLIMLTGTCSPAADNNDKYAFNRPATPTFAPGVDFFVADVYGNSRVIHYSKDGEYLGTRRRRR